MTAQIAPATLSDLLTVVNLCDGSALTVTAERGTQLIGDLTGDPLDATTYGSVRVTLTDRNGNTATLESADQDDTVAVIRAITSADKMADSRDRAADRTRPRA